MEWQQIIGFFNVAKLGSFTQAAEATFRTQSALSQQIKNLEEELECQLLERIGKRRLRMTRAGESFFQFAKTVLAHYDSLTEELSTFKRLPKGRLRIAAPFTTLYHLFPPVLGKYINQFPHVELTILDRSQQRVIELAKSGDIDFGLALESNVPKDLAGLRWKKVETAVMVPPGHPLTQVKRITLKQIAKYPLIVPPKGIKHTFRAELERHLRNSGIDFHIIMESSNVELSSMYVEMGLGVSLATIVKDLTLLKRRKLEFLPLNKPFQPDYIAVVLRRDKMLMPYKSAFIDMLLTDENMS